MIKMMVAGCSKKAFDKLEIKSDVIEIRCHHLLEMIAGGLTQSRALAALRDAPLPKLMSGEIRISTNNNLNNENK